MGICTSNLCLVRGVGAPAGGAGGPRLEVLGLLVTELTLNHRAVTLPAEVAAFLCNELSLYFGAVKQCLSGSSPGPECGLIGCKGVWFLGLATSS